MPPFTELLNTFFAFIYGSIVGSFVNVCVYRLPRGRSIFLPLRSYCPLCHEPIAWYDNVPIFSYFALRGCCRRCGSLISPRYVVIEILTACVFAVTWRVLSLRGETWQVMVIYEALAAVMICASAIDIELRMIPDSMTLGCAALTPVLSALVPNLHQPGLDNPGLCRAPGLLYARELLTSDPTTGAVLASLAGMAVGVVSLWIVARLGRLVFRKEAMGMGDIKYMALIGGVLGWKLTLLVFFLAPIIGAVVGIAIVLRTGDHHIPYGPYISVATWIVMLWGPWILREVQKPWLLYLFGMA